MIDLINRLRDQREELKLNRFKNGGGQTDEGVSPFKAKLQQVKPFFSNMFARVDMGEDDQPATTTSATALGAAPIPVDYTLAPGLTGYTPPASLSTKTPYAGLNGNQHSYMPGSDAEKAAQQQQQLKSQFTSTSSEADDNKDRNSLLTSLLASQGTSSLEGSLFGLGRGIGAKAGTPGKGAAIVGNAGALLFGGARSLMSGLAASKTFDRNQAWNREALMQPQNVYNNATQFQNANTTGGTAQGRYGGTLSYEDGGNTTFDSQATDDQKAKYLQIAQQLSDKYPTIESLDQYLQTAEIPDEAYQGILDEAQQIYGVDQQQQNQDVANLEDLNSQSASYREGGETQRTKAPFNKKVGDEIHFEYGGKTHKGTISKIENGKIYL